MDDTDKQRLNALLADRQVATLAVNIGDGPFASLVPFAMTEDTDAALIHASQLAKHSAGLNEGASYSILIHEPDNAPGANPAQLGRITLSGKVKPIPRDSEEYAAAKERYLAKFPKSEITFGLGDFVLYALQIDSARYVAGFGKTFDLSPADLADIRA
jgi:putative heme iron utilization protein